MKYNEYKNVQETFKKTVLSKNNNQNLELLKKAQQSDAK